MVYHHALACISSPKLYIINRRLYYFRNDDIQDCVLMICNASHWWYTRLSAWFGSNPSVKRVKYLFYRLFTKIDKFRQKFVVFYSSRRLGMESRVIVYGIAVGVWHHQMCIFLRLDSIRLLCNQFHTATSCGFHARLCRDWVRAGSNPSVKKVKYLFVLFTFL